MVIGFIGFGQVSSTLASLFKNEKLLTSAQNRSTKTIKEIKKSNVEILGSFREVAEKSDLLIVATSPANALKNAKDYGKYCNGIYLDLNNISPKTTLEINKNTNNFVDAAIIGLISENPTLYLSGKDAEKLKFLNNYLPVKIISTKISDASKLKLLRSIYTKNLSAILIETTELASKYNLEDELLNTIAITEGQDFKTKAISRIKNTKSSSKRKAEELQEILEYFDNENLEITKASLAKLNQL